jgi:hypothetical protein
MGILADALAGAAAKKGLTVDELVDAGRDCSVSDLPLAERPPGAITRRIEVPPLSSNYNPNYIELCLVQPKKVELSFLCSERRRASIELTPEQARDIAYLMVQGADLLDGKVVAVDDKGYDVLMDVPPYPPVEVDNFAQVEPVGGIG